MNLILLVPRTHMVQKHSVRKSRFSGTSAKVVVTASRRLLDGGFGNLVAPWPIVRQLITARGSAQRSSQDPANSKR